MKYFLSTVAILLLAPVFGQSSTQPFDFTARNHIKVVVNGDSLLNPWAGGLNYAQAHNIDLNRDGTQDIVIFDKSSKRILTFVAQTEGSEVIFRYTPKYEGHFPVPYSWMVVADYNCDGKKDVFYNESSYVRVLENTSESQLSFTDPLGRRLRAQTTSGNPDLYVPASDMPGIADIDDDGDLDIVSFTSGGSVMQFHENRANCGLDFNLTNSHCWGHFSESGIYRSVQLGACTPTKKKTMHAGSSVLLIDLDDDGLKDMLLGNVSFPDVSALYNTGSLDSTYFSSQDTLFPQYDKPVYVEGFPALQYTDINNDGVRDLVASPILSSGETGVNNKSLHAYTNQGTDTNPVFTFTNDSFLQEGMIDLGGGSVPRLVDLTNDGLLDLVVSNNGEYDTTASYLDHYYHFYENTGTAGQPQFTLVDDNFMDISSYSLGEGTIPTFGDLDGDGDQDMIIGDQNGQLHYFENSSATDPSFTLHTPGLTAGSGAIDVGNHAAPYLFDMDYDGDMDLLVGNYNGRIHYYSNASSSAPDFTLDNTFYGTVDTWGNQSSSGRAIPYVVEKDSLPSVFVGSSQQGVIQFDNVKQVNQLPSSLVGTFGTGKLVSSNYRETPFGINKKNGRNQFLIKASELKAQNMSVGNITKMAFNILSSNNNVIYKLNIRLKMVDDTVLTDFVTGMSDVRTAEMHSQTGVGQGWNYLTFDYPFFWDGESSIVVEVCFSGQNIGNPSPPHFIEVEMTDVGFNSHAYGDYVNTSLSGKGCDQPFKNVISKRPNVKLDVTPAFLETAAHFPEALYTAPALADLNGDGYPEMLVGNQAGGLTYHEGKEYHVSLPEQVVQKKNDALEVFPNPGSGIFNINVPNANSADLQVFDLTGKVILQKSISEKQATVNLNGRPTGIYLFILNSNEGVKTQKVMLE